MASGKTYKRIAIIAGVIAAFILLACWWTPIHPIHH
jgi:hypothetical protein